MEKDYSIGTYEYDKLNTPSLNETLRNRITRSMYINSIWYGGNDLELKKLYEKDLKQFKIGELTSDELNYFWAQSTTGLNIRKIHSGLPQLISEKMVDLLLSNGYEFNVLKDDEEETKDEIEEERLKYILHENNFNELLQEAIETESWAGGVAFKLSYNQMYDTPIIEVIQPDEYEPTIKAGRIVEDIFITYHEKDKKQYKLKEIYGFDEKGGYIRYKLYSIDKDKNLTSVSLSELDETKELKDIDFPGLKDKFSIYKPNKTPNSEFKNSKLGESDYSGSVGLFDAIDEVLSTMVQEFRDGKINKFWPSNLLPTNPITQASAFLPSLQKDFISYNGGIGEKEKPTKPEMIQGEIHSDKYIESYKKLLESALNNAGLSPQTIGVTGLDSTAASEESQELREKTSVRTREKKVDLWERCLRILFKLALQLDDFRQGKQIKDYNTKVIFNDYKVQTLADKTDIASKGIQAKTWSIKSAVDYINPDMTDEEKVLERVYIKIENGINIFTKEEETVYKKYVTELIGTTE